MQCHWAGQAVVFPLSLSAGSHVSARRTVQWQTALNISATEPLMRWFERTSVHSADTATPPAECRNSPARSHRMAPSAHTVRHTAASELNRTALHRQSPGRVFERAHTHTSSCIIHGSSSRMEAGQVNVSEFASVYR